VVLERLGSCLPAHLAATLAVEPDAAGLDVEALGLGDQAVMERLGVRTPGEDGGELARLTASIWISLVLMVFPPVFSVCGTSPWNYHDSTMRTPGKSRVCSMVDRKHPRAATDDRKPRHNLGLTSRLGPIQLTPDMLDELGAEAERQGIPVASAVRQAIRAWLDAAQKK
jgi:hypothetical protein